MNLSNLSRKVIEGIGKTHSDMFLNRLSPLQIIILTVTREMGFAIAKNLRGKRRTTDHPKTLFANDVRKEINRIYVAAQKPPYTTQGFWAAVAILKKHGYIYVAPHKKGTSLRSICLTALGEALFHYPQSVQLYTIPQPNKNQNH